MFDFVLILCFNRGIMRNNSSKYIIAIFLFLIIPLSSYAGIANRNLEMLIIKAQLIRLRIDLLRAGMVEVGPKECAQLNISWNRVSRATGYRLYRDDVLAYEGNSRQFTDSELFPGRRYEYVVYGIRGGEKGEPSEVQNITAPNICPPSVPVLRSQPGQCGGEIDIRWNYDRTANIYELYRGSRRIYRGPLTSYNDSNLTPNRSYGYRIRAGNIGGWSDFSDSASFVASGLCASSSLDSSLVIPELSNQEGTLSATIRTTPADYNKATSGRSRQSVMSFTLSAQYSDIKIERVDLFFDTNARIYLDEVELRRSWSTIAKEEITRNSLSHIGGGVYRLRITDINHTVRKGSSSVITVRVGVKSDQEEKEVTVFLDSNSIRGVDEAGLSQYAPADKLERIFVVSP